MTQKELKDLASELNASDVLRRRQAATQLYELASKQDILNVLHPLRKALRLQRYCQSIRFLEPDSSRFNEVTDAIRCTPHHGGWCTAPSAGRDGVGRTACENMSLQKKEH